MTPLSVVACYTLIVLFVFGMLFKKLDLDDLPLIFIGSLLWPFWFPIGVVYIGFKFMERLENGD